MDYKNGKIYKIANDINDDVYVGSTTQSLSKRMAKHKEMLTNKRKNHYNIYMKLIELGKEHFYIELIEEYQCDNVEQLRAREGHFIRQMGTLNARIEGRTKKEYTIDTKDIKREYDMKRREEKREEINAKKKQHYDKTKNTYMKNLLVKYVGVNSHDVPNMYT